MQKKGNRRIPTIQVPKYQLPNPKVMKTSEVHISSLTPKSISGAEKTLFNQEVHSAVFINIYEEALEAFNEQTTVSSTKYKC